MHLFWKSAISIVLALALQTAIVLPSAAGDMAKLNVIGFSDDGSVFAFEEYGVQDGSGFPYANRFYIETATDRFAANPIRVVIDDETALIDQARSEAGDRAVAAGLAADDQFQAGFAAGIKTVTELSGDPRLMIVYPRPVPLGIDAPLGVRLETFDVLATGYCLDIQETTAAFALVQLGVTDGGAGRLLHRDDTVPASRNCPSDYRIGGIFTYYPDNAQPVYAVMISVQSFGFEGSDYRWMAVTAPLN